LEDPSARVVSPVYRENTVHLLPIILLLGGCSTYYDNVEVRLKALETKTISLESENTDLMRRIDQIEDDHILCIECQVKCDAAKDAMDQVQRTFESFPKDFD
jgi:hypothetical protein